MAFCFAIISHYDLNTSLPTLRLILNIYEKIPNVYIDIIFALGVFGPLVGFLFVNKKKTEKKKFEVKKFSKWLLIGIAIPLLMNIVPLVLTWNKSQIELSYFTSEYVLFSIITYFLFNLLTSGTEEFGWRGFLFNDFAKSEKSFWDISWKTGLIWAIWHYPLMFYMYREIEILQILSIMFGFTMSIIGMAYISNWLYFKSESKIILMIFHALNNTWPYLFLIAFGADPFQLLSIGLIWAVVFGIEKFDKSLSSFDKEKPIEHN
jgi:membrane protease YdiL (CAAX protease family)